MIELELEAVARKAVFFGQLQRIVALCPHAHLAKFFTVYGYIAEDVFLRSRIAQKAFPVVELKLDRMDAAVIKQPVRIAGIGAGFEDAEALSSARISMMITASSAAPMQILSMCLLLSIVFTFTFGRKAYPI